MRVELLPSALGSGPARHQYLTSFLVNESVAIDAGSIGFQADLERQRRVRHVFITHSHLDHVVSLPLLLEHAYRADGDCVTVHASEAVAESLSRDLFNGRVWPDLFRLSRGRAPFLRVETMTDGERVRVGTLTVTPVAVDHTVPAQGLIVEEAGVAVVFGADSRPTTRLWEAANACASIAGAFIEASFPESLAALAEVSGHLTPRLLAQEAQKLTHDSTVVAVHIKPAHYETVCRELGALGLVRLEVGVPGREYRF